MALCLAVKQVIANVLTMFKITVPESMQPQTPFFARAAMPRGRLYCTAAGLPAAKKRLTGTAAGSIIKPTKQQRGLGAASCPLFSAFRPLPEGAHGLGKLFDLNKEELLCRQKTASWCSSARAWWARHPERAHRAEPSQRGGGDRPKTPDKAKGEVKDALHTTAFAYSTNVTIRAGSYAD